ncbi:MAG TPA: hypothetical protein ENF21_10035 [Bacteroidetes bacterium]|nr:hypothetical protein [Bacteroidota bacterium]
MNQDPFSFRSGNLLVFIWGKRVPLLILTGIAAVVSAVVSLLITPKYASTVVLFPSSSTSVSEALLSTSQFATNDLLEFGEEEEVERMLQILYSDRIRQELVDRFNLFDHYQIDPDSKYRYSELYSEMNDNISFRKTEFMSIEIRVLDTDPGVAADMANTIAALIDSTIYDMQREKAREAFLLVKREYENLQNEIRTMEDSLVSLRKLGVYDYEEQSKALSRAYVNAMASGDQSLAGGLEKKLRELAGYGQAYQGLQDFLRLEKERLSHLKTMYLQAKVDAEQTLPHTFVVSKAWEAEKKAYPRRSIIVLSAMLSTFVLALLLLALIEGIRNRKY